MKSFKFFIEARANTKSVRTGLSKRTKSTDQIQQAARKKEQDDAWEKLQQHIAASKKVNEDGMGAVAVAAGPTNTVGGVAGTGDSRLDPSQREPGISKKRNPTLGYFRRKPPKV